MSNNKYIIKLIESYQKNKPSYKNGRCVHIPSCSDYAIECYKKFNAFAATFYSTKRILTCTKFNKKVYDPVPKTKEEKAEEKVRLKELITLRKDLIKIALDNNINKSNFKEMIPILLNRVFREDNIYLSTLLLKDMIKNKVIMIPKNKAFSLIDEGVSSYYSNLVK